MKGDPERQARTRYIRAHSAYVHMMQTSSEEDPAIRQELDEAAEAYQMIGRVIRKKHDENS